MTFPVYLEVGGLRVHPHVVFEGLAYLVGFRLYLSRRRRMGDVIDGHTRWSIVAAAIVGAFVGSRVLAWFEDPALTISEWPRSVLFGGKTIVGGLIGGTVAVELVKRRLGVVARTGDLFAVSIAAGIAIGRIGCFLTGLDDQTFGSPSSLPWAIDFGDGVARHPVQLYESVAMAMLAGALGWFDRRPHRAGDVFRWFMVAYMTWRVVVDALKPEARLILGLSTLQLAALATALYCGRQLVAGRTLGRVSPPAGA